MAANIVRNTQRIFLENGIILKRNDGLATSLLNVSLRYLFQKYRIECVLDVGANRGQYRDFLREQVDYRGQIISFEPLNRNIGILRERARRDKAWQIAPYALGSENCEREINVMEDNVLSSFHDPAADSRGLSGNVVVARERVQVKRLDDVLGRMTDMSGSTQLFLKIDTQGHDLEVIDGATRTLERVAALQSEVSFLNLYDGTPDFCSSIKALTAAGFDVAGFAPVVVIDDRALEFDCVMINRRLAMEPPKGASGD